MSEIEFQDVTFLRGETSILESLSFHVGGGEILTLIGRSGAGKTTVLKLCNGLLLPARGGVVVGGRDTRGEGVLRKYKVQRRKTLGAERVPTEGR